MDKSRNEIIREFALLCLKTVTMAEGEEEEVEMPKLRLASEVKNWTAYIEPIDLSSPKEESEELEEDSCEQDDELPPPLSPQRLVEEETGEVDFVKDKLDKAILTGAEESEVQNGNESVFGTISSETTAVNDEVDGEKKVEVKASKGRTRKKKRKRLTKKMTKGAVANRTAYIEPIDLSARKEAYTEQKEDLCEGDEPPPLSPKQRLVEQDTEEVKLVMDEGCLEWTGVDMSQIHKGNEPMVEEVSSETLAGNDNKGEVKKVEVKASNGPEKKKKRKKVVKTRKGSVPSAVSSSTLPEQVKTDDSNPVDKEQVQNRSHFPCTLCGSVFQIQNTAKDLYNLRRHFMRLHLKNWQEYNAASIERKQEMIMIMESSNEDWKQIFEGYRQVADVRKKQQQMESFGRTLVLNKIPSPAKRITRSISATSKESSSSMTSSSSKSNMSTDEKTKISTTRSPKPQSDFAPEPELPVSLLPSSIAQEQQVNVEDNQLPPKTRAARTARVNAELKIREEVYNEKFEDWVVPCLVETNQKATSQLEPVHSSSSQQLTAVNVGNEELLDIKKASANPVHCPLCGNQFPRLYNLRRHLTRFHHIVGEEKEAVLKQLEPPFGKEADKTFVMTDEANTEADSEPIESEKAEANAENPVSEKERKAECGKLTVSDKPFRCHICRSQFSWRSNLSRHLRKMHKGGGLGERIVQPAFKGRPFQWKGFRKGLNGNVKHTMMMTAARKTVKHSMPIISKPVLIGTHHLYVIHDTSKSAEALAKPFKCKICNARYVTRKSVVRHLRNVHPQELQKSSRIVKVEKIGQKECNPSPSRKKFNCRLCGQEFNYSYNMRRHMRRLHFKNRSDLSNEYFEKEEGSLLKEAASSSQPSLDERNGQQDELDINANSIKFVTENYAAGYENLLEKSTNSSKAVIGSKPAFSCPKCKMKVTGRWHLSRHMKVKHGGQRQRDVCRCLRCRKSFSAHNLIRHLEKVHKITEAYACLEPGCGAKFHRFLPLKQHVRIKHQKKLLTCPKPGGSFIKPGDETSNSKSINGNEIVDCRKSSQESMTNSEMYIPDYVRNAPLDSPREGVVRVTPPDEPGRILEVEEDLLLHFLGPLVETKMGDKTDGSKLTARDVHEKLKEMYALEKKSAKVENPPSQSLDCTYNSIAGLNVTSSDVERQSITRSKRVVKVKTPYTPTR